MKLPKFFLDSCNPAESAAMVKLLGHLDGQTTNPTLLVKNPEVQKFTAGGKRIHQDDLLKLYHEAIEQISKLTPGAVSVEVYADWNTTAQEMLTQANKMVAWGPNIYLKFPTIPEGLRAAHEFVTSGGHVNMTLVFDQHQAAAVYSATLATQGTSFVSPFVGRWDDRGRQGVDLIANIVKMYKKFDSELGRSSCHTEVLAASVRHLDHFYASIALGAGIITAPLSAYEAWVAAGRQAPTTHTMPNDLAPIEYEELEYTKDFASYKNDSSPDGLLNQGLVKFANDWNNVVQM